MSISHLPLSYCTNVHPGQTVAEVEAGLDRYAVAVAANLGRPLAAGLWLANPVVDELLASPDALPRFAAGLRRRGLTCHTLNAFPYGNFHSARVKENVYLPDWSQPQRGTYTRRCADVLAALLPEGTDGSISTLPLGFKGFGHSAGFDSDCIRQLLDTAEHLHRLHAESGKLIRLAVEPEPFCILETTDEAIAFFRRLWDAADRANVGDAARRHVGLCFDVCHQAVEFEDVAGSVRALDAAGVRINKVHLSCAIQLDRPMENEAGRDALRQYIEPRYLHQTMARLADGSVARARDLSDDLVTHPPDDFRSAPAWRVHFHVPVDAENLGPLATTRAALPDAIAALAALSYAPHLEVETYTWEVLPGVKPGAGDLTAGLTREMVATYKLLAARP